MFGNQHLIALLFFIIFGYILIKWAKKLSKEKQHKVGNIFAFSLSITVIIWTFLKIYTEDLTLKKIYRSPLQFCCLITTRFYIN